MERGWREYNDSGTMKDHWNLWWRTSGFPVNHYKLLKPWQYTNHIPRGSLICRKDNLARSLKCMRKVYGSIYDFSPPGYNLPLEYTKLVAECSRQNQNEQPYVWICKPVSQSQGRGIFLFRKLSELCYDSNAVVQRYIQNPLLIGGYKFDLRLYVCIPSFHPLTVYLYREGLARFGTDKFTLADLGNPFCHLTNSSLNKLGPGYTEKKERVGSGCKWTLKQLRHYFHQSGILDWLLWQRVSSLIVLTVLSQTAGIPSTANCFEFYGFDVLVDSCLRPWLLEVNLSPALGNDCDVDAVVKKPMLHDMFDLLGLPVCNTGLSLFTIWSVNMNKTYSEKVQTLNDEDSEYSKGNDSDTDIEIKNDSHNASSLTVMAVASKWKRRHHQNQSVSKNPTYDKLDQKTRKKSATKQRSSSPTPSVYSGECSSSAFSERKNRSNVTAAATTYSKSYTDCNTGACSSERQCINVNEDDFSCTSNSQSNCEDWIKYNSLILDKSKLLPSRGFRGRTKCSSTMMWGNGRDWRTPPATEGNWVRIYPLGQTSKCNAITENQETYFPSITSSSVGDKEVKVVVAAVHRYSKVAREIFRRHTTLADEDYNSLMQSSLGLTTDVWLPLK